MPTARGSFNVAIESEPPFFDRDGVKLNVSVVRKEFSGDLAGSSEGRMVAAHTAVPGSAGYVAIERFEGSLGGKSGGFVLQHHGLMSGGEAALTVAVVPDSGTGGLAGISGSLEIDNDSGQHSYVLTYRTGG